MFDSIYPADLPCRQPRGSEHGINHGGAHIAVAEMFLYGADVVVWFWQVSCKEMAEIVAAGVFVDSGFKNGVFYGALHKGFVYVPAFFLTC